MQLIPLIIAVPTVMGIGYFGLDLYRNRHRLSKKPNSTVDLSYLENLPTPDGDEVQAIEHTASHVVHHAASEASHCLNVDVTTCIDAISHTITHH